MQKQEVAAIPMRPTSTSIQHLAGNGNYDEFPDLKPLVPFDDIVVEFLNELSTLLLRNTRKREFPDVTTFGFFIRKANVRRRMKTYSHLTSSVGRGVSFHIAPSNVPVNFAFSLAMGLLSGNACIVRVSSKLFPQTDVISQAISSVLEKTIFSDLKKYIAIVRYERDFEINAYFSSLCDVRVIWGGNETVSELRKAALPPRSFDITFADRYSFCIIRAEEYLGMKNKEKIATDFYNDTYLFDQNACSSPRLVYWVGSASVVSQARETFWAFLHETLVDKKYSLQTMMAIEKYTVSCQAALDYDNVKIPSGPDNLVSRITLDRLPLDLPEHTCAGGSFFEYSDDEPDELFEIVSRKFQTLTYIGFTRDELRNLFAGKGSQGIDRIVPCGRAAEFSLVWDGYDLISHMSRVVLIE